MSERDQTAWPIEGGVVVRCDVLGCKSRATWHQIVEVGASQEWDVLLHLCPYHTFEVHEGPYEDPIFAEHYHCDLCGGPVEQMGGDDDTYICAGDCAQGSCGEIVFDQARERLRAAWAAEQPPDEEEKDER